MALSQGNKTVTERKRSFSNEINSDTLLNKFELDLVGKKTFHDIRLRVASAIRTT